MINPANAGVFAVTLQGFEDRLKSLESLAAQERDAVQFGRITQLIEGVKTERAHFIEEHRDLLMVMLVALSKENSLDDETKAVVLSSIKAAADRVKGKATSTRAGGKVAAITIGGGAVGAAAGLGIGAVVAKGVVAGALAGGPLGALIGGVGAAGISLLISAAALL
ncbi:MAG: hypothetical protein LBS68_01270 [Puniceicoccales bacterium]|jgi:hypothetical protein|nr:hypothetical protein [Puniceicoccales bacterium]